MSSIRIHCCYIINSTDFKEKTYPWAWWVVLLCNHQLWKKKKSLSSSPPWELQAFISSTRAPDFLSTCPGIDSLSHLLCDYFQFTLIHGPNIRGSYAILLFKASNFTSITGHVHNWVSFLLWLHPFILSGAISPHWSPVAYWASTDLGSSSFSILSFCLFTLFMGFVRHLY